MHYDHSLFCYKATIRMISSFPSSSIQYVCIPNLLNQHDLSPISLVYSHCLFHLPDLINYRKLISSLYIGNITQTRRKTYKLPQGGLFTYVNAPHYFFELIAWFALTLVSRHVFSVATFEGMVVYLSQRANAQTK